MTSKNISIPLIPRRHRVYWRIFRFVIRPYLCGVLRFSPEPAPKTEAPVLVLANHNTDFDPAFVALSFENQMYFVASEHIFRWGWITRLLVHMFAPIPLIKGRSDAQAALGILRLLRKGNNICIFAEGNRSVDGITAPISPATGLLAKSGVDLITYRLEGGYFTQPRWAKSMRRGKMRGRIIGHYPAAQLKGMQLEEINELIQRDLYENAYERQAHEPVAFRGKGIAEHLETALFLCPACMQVGTLKSSGSHITCTCGLSAEYTETGYLKGEGLSFDTVAKWYAWQIPWVKKRANDNEGETLFSDADQALYEVEPCEGAAMLTQGELRMTRDALHLNGHTFLFEEMAAMAIVGQMTITFSLQDGRHFEIKSECPRSGYKYLLAFEALRRREDATE